MARAFLVSLLVAASSLKAQSRVDLLQRVANHYSNADGFDVKGTASALMPGTSWRVTYEFETEGAQPNFLPLNLRKPSIQATSRVGSMKQTQDVPGGTDPRPQHAGLMPMAQFTMIATRLLNAQKIGAETLTVGGHAYACEIIDATYDYSPAFKPNSHIEHKHFWVDPSSLVVLRETRTMADHPECEWTGEVTSFSFDGPPSESLLQALKRFATQPKDRSDWVGRPVPDLSLKQLSGGPAVKLADLRGKPLLLDFWGSYCAPCKRTTVHAQELGKSYQASGLQVLTFTQDSADDARAWADYNRVTVPVLLDPDGAAFKAFDIQGVPVAILIGADGKVAHYWVGLDDPASMDAVIAENVGAHSAPSSTGEQRQ